MRVDLEVVVGDGATHELAVEVVVSGVDVPDAGVGVGVAVGAGAEGTVWNREVYVIKRLTHETKHKKTSPAILTISQVDKGCVTVRVDRQSGGEGEHMK